jgi:hypothetical protein
MTQFQQCEQAADLLGLRLLRHNVTTPQCSITTYTVKQGVTTLYTCNHVSALDTWLESRFVAELVTYPVHV